MILVYPIYNKKFKSDITNRLRSRFESLLISQPDYGKQIAKVLLLNFSEQINDSSEVKEDKSNLNTFRDGAYIKLHREFDTII